MKLGIIADEDTISGFLLAGAGEAKPNNENTFLVVSNSTKAHQIETFYQSLMARSDIAIIIMTQAAANQIRAAMDTHKERIIPTVVEIPTKTETWSADDDAICCRVRLFLGSQMDKILAGEEEKQVAN